MQELTPSDLSILLLEPSPTQSKIIVKHLAEEGVHNVEVAGSIAATVDILNDHKPDLVISSLHFNDGNALELVRKLKSDDDFAHIPFMLVSSERRKSQLEEFKQSGVVAILPKPFSKDHLGKAINATLDILAPSELELELFDVHDLRVLVVDDSRLARNHIKRVLTNLGMQHLMEAVDGKQAIGLLQEHMFDIVVTDYNMPEVNGRELTEFIRQKSTQSHIPILMVSSEVNDTHLANIAQSGVDAMCDKPFEPENVKQILYSLLNQD
ncbi:response regulator [Flocculibacter collagenilyticus]|uniref:response regulator n=1 Tax=Flocculibacter collagenilyticus TaxID=2744479 RepID=UPI0018F6E348|nr:response regulator [Flocculibacter collagenilyticus]